MASIFALLIGVFILGSTVINSSVTGGSISLTPAPTAPPGSTRGCLTKKELEDLKSQPVAFTCNGVNYVLGASDVEIGRIYVHSEKQLVPKEICDGITYYTWKCHPPEYGSLYKNTLWKLVGPLPLDRPIKDKDHFNIYIRQDANPEGYWICSEDRQTLSGFFAVAPSELKGKVIGINGISATWINQIEVNRADINPEKKLIGKLSIDSKEYDVYSNLLLINDEKTRLYLVESGLLINPPEIVIVDVFSIIKIEDVLGKTLKLSTFNPNLSNNPWWEVYLPESKPVIYLYPKTKINLNLKILPQDGYLTVSDPLYDEKEGWKGILAYPDGKIIYKGKPYPYLYYESEVKGYQIPQKGFVVEKNKIGSFFREVLPKVGLNEKEAKDFSDYWEERVINEVKTEKLFVTFIPQSQVEVIDRLELNILPQTVIRVRIYLQPLDNEFVVEPLFISPAPRREGFTLVEWGGILVR